MDLGTVNLPANREASDLYLGAGCDGQLPQHVCNTGGSRGVWSSVAVAWANLLLSSDAQPTGADFRGSLLDTPAHGTANLAFTGDPGPGVYKVALTIGTKEVYNQTPNKNSGKCVPVGTDTASGALMFSYQQPCPPSQTLDIPVRTTTFVDGAYELKVTVTNAAQNPATVLRRTIRSTTARRSAPTGRRASTSSKPTPRPAPHPSTRWCSMPRHRHCWGVRSPSPSRDCR